MRRVRCVPRIGCRTPNARHSVQPSRAVRGIVCGRSERPARIGEAFAAEREQAATSGPRPDDAKAVNLNVAAHIAAAAPGCPRYEFAMETSDRASITNAIWLCQNCAKLIDNDTGRFTVDVVRAWKTIAEDRARHNIGKTASENSTPSIQVKSVGPGYIKNAGISELLRPQGYMCQWVFSEKKQRYLEFQDWELYVHVDKDGRKWHLQGNSRDRDGIGDGARGVRTVASETCVERRLRGQELIQTNDKYFLLLDKSGVTGEWNI